MDGEWHSVSKKEKQTNRGYHNQPKKNANQPINRPKIADEKNKKTDLKTTDSINLLEIPQTYSL